MAWCAAGKTKVEMSELAFESRSRLRALHLVISPKDKDISLCFINALDQVEIIRLSFSAWYVKN